MTNRRGIAISGAWVLVIVTPLMAFVLWAAINYANTQRDQALRASLERQHMSLTNGCHRGNVLRYRVNNAIRIEHDFLATARIARLAAVQTATNPADRALNQKAASNYATYIRDLKPIPLVDCAKAYPKT